MSCNHCRFYKYANTLVIKKRQSITSALKIVISNPSRLIRCKHIILGCRDELNNVLNQQLRTTIRMCRNLENNYTLANFITQVFYNKIEINQLIPLKYSVHFCVYMINIPF